MADKIISFLPENDRAFQIGLDRLARTVSDFRPAFERIHADWMKSNRKLFTLQSRGLYQDLAPSAGEAEAGGITTTSNYKARKMREVGFVYPILKRTGALERSITQATAPGAVKSISRDTLVMGTNVKNEKGKVYPIYHQSDRARSKIPQRKMIFIDGGPAERARDASIAGRRERWLNTINTIVLQVVTGELVD